MTAKAQSDLKSAKPTDASVLPGSAPADPLLNCLVFLTRYYGKPFSAQALGNGLPLENGQLPIQQFSRAAERGGLTAKLTRSSLNDVSDLLLPCVLLLTDGRACVVLARDSNKGTVDVTWPETPDGVDTLAEQQLQALASGYLFFVRKRYRFDARAPEVLKTREGHWFWRTLRESTPIYRDVLVASFFLSLFAIASPLFVMNVYDRVVPNEAIETLWVLAIGMFIVIVFDFVMKQIRAKLLDIAAKKTDVQLSSRLFEKVLALKMEARPPSIGAFARNIQEFDSIRDFITSATISAFIDVPFSILFIVVIALVGGPIAFIPVVAMILMVLYGFYIKGKMRLHVEQGGRFSTQKHAHLIEAVSGLESLKINGAESQFQQKWEELVGNNAIWNVEMRRYAASVGNVSSFIQQLSTVLIVAGGVFLISDGAMSMGAMIAAVMLSGRAMGPFSQVAMLTTRYNQAESTLAGLDEIMKMPEENMDRNLHRPYIDGRIEFDNVSFAYPGSQVPALDSVSFSIQPGEKVAIIGRIGAGKTTVEKLLLGFYQQSAGSIRVDGIDIQQISPADVRQKVGCLPQDIHLFFGSIRDNITVGVPHVDDAKVIRAAELAGVNAFTNLDPEGLDRQVGERGQYLSGGQRQAVALARALLFNPPIMVLDEPTSNMDNSAETGVRQRLKSLTQDKTFLLITHKMSMLELVDRVIVMERGKLILDGPRQSVLQRLAEGKVRAQ
ncbi:type I secretion system permease/ATPase [Aestuariirhabdus sp. Z084]|uniref:type I secretion system permease/ATPase n=1 Tax=Aestuariirhabdus haliotis TaxID=2918751 RepID=UPI00201B3EF0|nr:type I secretion system permease/ATPase [Aestuariirhabdus haliotis]MCL6417463.1 type I secretion system permease/ATPase [Aestuariirhabdus haliotis]MCL6421418.1 type I secretion system permease/ATPase [Aestuariirhabdus haliotis]